LTARDQDTDKIKARKVGADDYLTKPCPLDQLAERIETVMDRLEQARKIPLDQIGLSGRLEEVNVLDLVQMLELNQNTGALVLSHGERTGTLYFKDGAIVDADIRSPKREEPLFVLLGWKAGRYLFLPDAVPNSMPITASLAHLLFEDLHKVEQHEQQVGVATENPLARQEADTGPVGQVLAHLEEITERFRAGHATTSDQQIARILVVGVTGSGKSELIEHLVSDLSSSRWAAVGNEGRKPQAGADFGLIRLSPDMLLHLIAVRAEKRFRSIWEQCVPEALGVILLVNPEIEGGLSHVQTFLRAQQILAPSLSVQALLPERDVPVSLAGLDPSHISSGSIDDQTVRLSVLDRVLQHWLSQQSPQAKAGR
jgi:hypothetical protein